MNTKLQRIGIGGDHAGFALKEKIKTYLEEGGYFVRGRVECQSVSG